MTSWFRRHAESVPLARRLRITKLQKLALEDLLVAAAEDDDAPIDEGPDEPSADAADAPALRCRPDEGHPDRPDQEVLPPLRADGAGTSPQPPDPGQHGRAEPFWSRIDVHLPLYHQHEIFARMGADIPESTLVGCAGGP